MAKGTPRKAVKTQKQIDAMKATGEPYKVGLGNGLTCRVSATGEKSFLLQFNRHGRRRTISFGSISLADAKLLAAQARMDLAQDADPTEAIQKRRESLITMEQFLDGDYADHIRHRQRRPQDTIRNLKTQFKSWLPKPLASITKNKAEDWRTRRLDEGLSIASCNRYINSLKAMTRNAADRGLLPSDPLSTFRRLPDRRLVDIRWLTPIEEDALLEALQERNHELLSPEQLQWIDDSDAMDAHLFDGAPAPAQELVERALDVKQMFGDHLLLIVTLALNYGLRRQEVLQLRWDSVKPTSDDRWQLFITPESDKAGRGRYIPLNDSDWAIIMAWHHYQTGNKGIQSPWMFPHGPKLEPMTEIKSSWRGLIRRAAKRQPSLAGTTFRVLRATFGSKLVQKGVPILEVSRLLGHSSVTITEQHYAALSNQSAREAISMLDVLNDLGSESASMPEVLKDLNEKLTQAEHLAGIAPPPVGK